jgi:hypothetical protein
LSARIGADADILPGDSPKEKAESAKRAGADFMIRPSDGELPASESSSMEEDCVSTGPPVLAVRVGGLTRFSEIYTHPGSREAVLARLRSASRLLRRVEASFLILKVKETVPADVALPAYRVGLREWREELQGAKLLLEPGKGWPPEELRLLAEGLGVPESDWSLAIDGSVNPESLASDIRVVGASPRLLRIGWAERLPTAQELRAAMGESEAVPSLSLGLSESVRRGERSGGASLPPGERPPLDQLESAIALLREIADGTSGTIRR